ncbi:alpha/beta hydrolase [soil metagenome]
MTHDPYTTPFATRRHVLMGAAALLFAPFAPALAAPAPAAPFASRRITVTVRGSGPDVVLIPGVASGPGIWNGVLTAVPGYRYHLVQVRGFAGLAADANESGPLIGPLVDEVARYITASALARPAIVGHSMGGTLAMLLALRPAPTVGRVMVVDMLPDGAGMVGGTASGMGYLADQLGDYFTATAGGRRMFADMLSNSPGAKGSDPDVIANALRELAHTDLGPRLPRIVVPLKIVYAVAADAQERTGQMQRFRAAYASARTAVLQPIGPSGHVIMADQPVRFAASLAAFLK